MIKICSVISQTKSTSTAHQCIDGVSNMLDVESETNDEHASRAKPYPFFRFSQNSEPHNPHGRNCPPIKPLE